MPLAAAVGSARTDLQDSHKQMVNEKRQMVNENKKGAFPWWKRAGEVFPVSRKN